VCVAVDCPRQYRLGLLPLQGKGSNVPGDQLVAGYTRLSGLARRIEA